MSDGFIWYDKTATDDRVWCVRMFPDGPTVRASDVSFTSGTTVYNPEGMLQLQPGGPRGVIHAHGIKVFDEVPCG